MGVGEVFPESQDGLRDLQGVAHIHLVCPPQRSRPSRLNAKPFLQDRERDVFATRASCWHNAIGLSIVNIRPYTAKFDREDERGEDTTRQRGRRGYGNGGAA